MRGRVLIAGAGVALGVLACQTRSEPPEGSAGAAPSASAQTASAPAASASGPAALPAASALVEPASSGAASSSAAAGVATAPPTATAPTIAPRCCRLERTEGGFGPDKGANVRYSGDVLLRNDGGRLLFPQDLINDTKELYIFAKSAGKSLYQERRLRIVGEGPKHVSVEIDDRGETGATTPFYHSRCATIELRKVRKATLDEVLPPAQATALLEEGKRRFERMPEHDRFRFVSASFALTANAVRFCCPARDDKQATPRLDIEIALDAPGPK